MNERATVRRELAMRWVVVLTIFASLLTFSAVAVNSFQVRQVVREVRSCTNPSGDCYKRQQESSGEVVGSINDAVICAAYYADQPGVVTEEEIRDCMKQRSVDHPPDP